MKSEYKMRWNVFGYSSKPSIGRQHTFAFAPFLIIIKTKKGIFALIKKISKSFCLSAARACNYIHRERYAQKQLGCLLLLLLLLLRCCSWRDPEWVCIYFGFRQFDDATLINVTERRTKCIAQSQRIFDLTQLFVIGAWYRPTVSHTQCTHTKVRYFSDGVPKPMLMYTSSDSIIIIFIGAHSV